MSNILTVYFSAEGNTAKLAQLIAETAGSEIFEIKPETPYTAADINWKNPLARCNREKIGRKDVPFVGDPDNIESYDTILVGFPIWYYGAPNIVQTFLKKYDFTGKKLALFATSGGSGMGKTADKITALLDGKCKVVSAQVFKADASAQEISSWLRSIK